ncbi:MAG: putative KH and PIN-domain containing protein [Candidatus Heimdallarchaeota archaeon LC_2]|nr:MAG: putative KH and PIN-domain containing protein [Candidatus Heimdallarchaeota archaeon LC_2]
MIELEQMFDVFENTMSLHLRENLNPQVKHGNPGEWSLDPISDDILDRDYLESLTQTILEIADEEANAFIEDDQELVQVIQLHNYRIVITIPPFSDAYEITIVRPTIQKKLSEYNIPEKLLQRLEDRAEGILIAGAPGHGKSTFAAALTNFYADQQKIIKTIEKPRDLQLDDRITQFTTLPEDVEKLADVLLLMRPDYVIFDEIRKNLDFNVYTDMRLAGVGMVGVIHATQPIDAIQRFVTRIELGLIANVIDTVIFIFNGDVETVLSLKMLVKTPSGFNDQGLARPVIEVRNFLNRKPLYEMFSFGEQIVVIPLTGNEEFKRKRKKPKDNRSYRHSRKKQNLFDLPMKSKFTSEGNNLPILEIIETRKHLIVKVENGHEYEQIQLMIGPQIMLNAIIDPNGEIKLSRKKATTKRLERFLDRAESPLTVRRV